jgi:hypothetical protein
MVFSALMFGVTMLLVILSINNHKGSLSPLLVWGDGLV